jgi:hypothetical protein
MRDAGVLSIVVIGSREPGLNLSKGLGSVVEFSCIAGVEEARRALESRASMPYRLPIPTRNVVGPSQAYAACPWLSRP